MIPTTTGRKEAQILEGRDDNTLGKINDLEIARDQYGAMWSCWKASWRERLSILFTGKVWLAVYGIGHPPICIVADPGFKD